jgi:tRNA(Glu) U13 pseudouridine synthase TruD
LTALVRFDRNVKAESTQMIDEIMESMKTRGFVNYYGMQRFGTAAVSSHSVGLHLLKGEWKEACEAILSRRPGEHPDGDAARRAYWERNDLQEALKLMPRRNTAERAIWEFWARPNQEIGNYFGGLLAVSTSAKGSSNMGKANLWSYADPEESPVDLRPCVPELRLELDRLGTD